MKNPLRRLPEGTELPPPRRLVLGVRPRRRGGQRLDVANGLRRQVLRPGALHDPNRRAGPEALGQVDRETPARERMLPGRRPSIPQRHEGT